MTRSFNTRIIFRTMGALLLFETIFMALALGVTLWFGEPDDTAFLVSTIITFIAGLIGLLIGRNASHQVSEREGYVIVALVWVVFSAFGMLPYFLSGAIDNISDAWFETMAGFTTTGSTVIGDVEAQTHGILFWRAITQWVGGLGIIVLCLALLPMFGLGGMQLYAAEMTGVYYEKLSPRIADTSKKLWGLYILLTVIEAILLSLFGMSPFDAICHSFTTIATGGFSTYNLSLINSSPAIQYTIAVFMLLSGINFALIIHTLTGKARRLIEDEEARWYFRAVAVCTAVLSVGLILFNAVYHHLWYIHSFGDALVHIEQAFRQGFFMATSALTSTGFAVVDYTLWPQLLWVGLFFMMFTGACSGSTSGGIKWVRILIFIKSGVMEFKRRIHPNAVMPIMLNNRPLGHETISNIMAFMLWYIVILGFSVLVFCGCGVHFDEAVGAAVSAIGNVGVGIGQYGPVGSWADFPEVAKWWMTLVMLIGRLEIFTVLLLFTRALWKK